METEEENDDLAAFDAKPRFIPYALGSVPSINRFFSTYSHPDEARHAAQWLAEVTKKAIDIVPTGRGTWVFSDAARSCAERYFYVHFEKPADERARLEQELIDDDQADSERRVDRLIESRIENPTCRLNVNADGESWI